MTWKQRYDSVRVDIRQNLQLSEWFSISLIHLLNSHSLQLPFCRPNLHAWSNKTQAFEPIGRYFAPNYLRILTKMHTAYFGCVPDRYYDRM
jgi:hypothetical protein